MNYKNFKYNNNIKRRYNMNKKNRTEAQRAVRAVADGKDLSADCLTREAISSGIFIKPGTDSKESYSQSWVLGRLRQNDKKVAKKLVEFAAAI